jgi:hypothetical protein
VKSRENSEPLILCEKCENFVVEVGLKEAMDKHREKCEGKVGTLVVRKQKKDEKE